MFHKWIIGEMGALGEFMYQPIHLYSTAVVFAVLLVAILIALAWKDAGKKRKFLLGISIFQLGFEVLWRLVYWLVKGDSPLCWWPVYPCNLGGILIPLIAIFNSKRGKQMFYLFGFVGGCLTFALPEGIFCRDVLVFPILKSILQHTGLLLIPAIELASGTFRPSLKDTPWAVGGCLIHLFNCEFIVRLLGFTGDYMFLRSGLPFVIPGIPSWITTSVFALLVLVLLLFLLDIKTARRLFKKKSKTTN